MKKLTLMVVVVLSLCLVASFAFAGMMKGTLKSVDASKNTVVVTIDGKDQTMSVGAGVDISTVKAGDAVEVTVDKDMVTAIQKAKPRAIVGC
jgi:hypothetical protein